jgi:hypothetical protein
MPRVDSRPKRKRAVSAPSRPKANSSRRSGSATLDPKTEKEINSLFIGLMRRLLIACAIMLVLGIISTGLTKSAHAPAAPVIFLSILLGVTIAYHRGVDRVFEGVKQIGVDRLRQKRYADAAFALENFHRVGNMGRDRQGEAHYYLMQAYQGLGNTDKAAEIAAWLRKNRKRSEWTKKAEGEIAAH